jgi:hypothetical protein
MKITDQKREYRDIGRRAAHVKGDASWLGAAVGDMCKPAWSPKTEDGFCDSLAGTLSPR